MNDHVAKPIDKAPGALPARSSRQERRRARRQRQRTRANWSRRGGDIVGRFGGSLELIVQVLRRFVPDMQDLFAQLERQLGEGDVEGSAATLHTIKGSASTVGASAWPAVPASWSRPCAAPIRGAVWKSSPASASTNCAPCAMPACSACRRCSATCRRSRRAEPRCGGLSRQGFRRTRGSPASAAACRADNAMGVIRRYS